MENTLFVKEDWMIENDIKQGEAWESLRGKPKYEFCDIILKDGAEIGPCWARGKDFIDVSSDEEDGIQYSRVDKVRYYDAVEFAEDDDEDSDDHDYNDGGRFPELKDDEDSEDKEDDRW